MASAATQQPRDISSYLEPSSDTPSSFGKYSLPPSKAITVIVDDELVELPAGFNALLVQPRKCGDFYAEFEGPRSRAAIGATRLAAIRNLISRVSA